MRLLEAIKKLDDDKEKWPGGYNFENKSKFLGITLGGVCLTQEMLDSNEWGFTFESHNKKFNKAIESIFNKFAPKE